MRLLRVGAVRAHPARDVRAASAQHSVHRHGSPAQSDNRDAEADDPVDRASCEYPDLASGK